MQNMETSSLEIETYVRGYHAYKNIWNPKLGEVLVAERESDNSYDKFAVAVKKNGQVVGHLKKGKSGWFSKSISYFLKYPKSSCHIEITGKKANLGDKQGLQVPCTVKLNGHSVHIQRLKNILEEKNEL